ncbi:hypothetical protein [Kineococcus sp. SYSU DK004]|uniref:hypothetical protein n=1 Tax=Kineococcus sp. SYSU DK004 TaxID=3383125 RepID=UPI003D7CA2BD
MTDDRSHLAVPDYDHLPTAALADRARTLDAAQLAQIIAYEEAHGAREPVLTVLRQRASQLDAGAQPSGGDPAGLQPEAAGAPSGEKVGDTDAPPVNPPSHGVPTNPTQPRG